MKSLITPPVGSSTGFWVDFLYTHTHSDLFSRSKGTRLELEGKHLKFLRDFKRIIVFICIVCYVVCKEVFAGDDAQLSGIPMQNDQSHIKSKIYYVCGHATRHMLFQETYNDHQENFVMFSELKFENKSEYLNKKCDNTCNDS